MFRLPLKFEAVTESRWGNVVVRHHKLETATAERAARTVEAVIPVVERYLGATQGDPLRLELLSQARFSGVNPATGTIRHAVRGFSERSPRLAGVLSYQVGQILWYRSTQEAAYPGHNRTPYWLTEAALLPLMFIWSTRYAWLDYLSRQIDLVQRCPPLSAARLVQAPSPDDRDRLLIGAHCLLRGLSLSQRCDDWVRRLRALLATDSGLSGLAALEQLSGMSATDWEARFAEDLQRWRELPDRR